MDLILIKREVRLAGKKLHQDLSIKVLEGQVDSDSLSLFNISRTGMFLEGVPDLPTGTPIKLALHFGADEKIIAHTDVRWARPTNLGPFQPRGLGVRISHIAPHELQTFENYLDHAALRLTASDIMAVGDFVVPPTLTIRELDELRRQKYLPAAIVAEPGKAPLGVIAVEWAFSLPGVRNLFDFPVTELMRPTPPVIHPDMDGGALLKELFSDNQFVYVVGENIQQPFGLLTQELLGSVWPMMWKSLIQESLSPLEQGVYRLVHDLRTPLATIHSTHSLFADGTIDANSYLQRGFAAAVDSNCQRLIDLTEDMLQLAKGGRRDSQVELVETLLYPLITDIVQRLHPFADQRGMSFDIVVSQTLTWPTMPRVIIRLLENLIGNSLHNGSAGSRIRIAAEADAKHLELSVADQGEGINAELLSKIEGALSDNQAATPSALSKSNGTHGFGLAIVRQLLAILNGTCQVTANDQGGLTVRIFFPHTPLRSV